jgi:hypothetical protein
MPNKTANEALEMLLKEIGAYNGAAMDRAVYGVVGAAAALASMGVITEDEACDWRGRAKDAGELQTAAQRAADDRKGYLDYLARTGGRGSCP